MFTTLSTQQFTFLSRLLIQNMLYASCDRLQPCKFPNYTAKPYFISRPVIQFTLTIEFETTDLIFHLAHSLLTVKFNKNGVYSIITISHIHSLALDRCYRNRIWIDEKQRRKFWKHCKAFII